MLTLYRLTYTTIFITLLSIAVFQAKGETIIRDSEIEETINLIAAPLIKTAKLQQVKIYLINSNQLNAFTAGGNNIYIYSGLINYFPDIDVIRGVIAHEIGHIIGRHVARQLENIDIYNKVALSSIAIGLATSLAGNPSVPFAIMLGGVEFAEKSLLSYSRAFESSADQSALKLLENSSYSCKGMIDFFEYMKTQHSSSLINPYDQTHPSGQERLTILRNFYQKSHSKNAHNSAELEYKFARSAAKLLAFTVDPTKLLADYNKKIDTEIVHYIAKPT